MDPTINALTSLLKSRFSGSDVRLEADDRITGYLIWEGFRGVDHGERQENLWDTLKAAYPGPERQQIGIILTYTPDEIQLMKGA